MRWTSLVFQVLAAPGSVCLLLGLATSTTPAAPPEPSRQPEVYAFCFDTHDAAKRDLPRQAMMLRDLGYDGAGHIGLEHLEQRIQTLDAAGLRLYLAGVTIDLQRDFEEQVPRLSAVLPLLQGRPTALYAVVTGLPPGAAEGIEPAVSALRRLSGLADQQNVRIGIYPHTGDWVATVPQAVALAQRVDRANCGVIFNLCHFLRNEPVDSLNHVLDMAAPHLVGVTINGADLAGRGDKDWRRLIQPLDQGSFDLASLLEQLRERHYSGPIGIMCYGIAADAQEHLARSLRSYRRLMPTP